MVGIFPQPIASTLDPSSDVFGLKLFKFVTLEVNCFILTPQISCADKWSLSGMIFISPSDVPIHKQLVSGTQRMLVISIAEPDVSRLKIN